MKILLAVILLTLTTGCGSSLTLGVGYDLNHDRDDFYGHISDGACVGTVQVESPRKFGIGAEYFHASGLCGTDHDVVDIASVTYKYTFASMDDWRL